MLILCYEYYIMYLRGKTKHFPSRTPELIRSYSCICILFFTVVIIIFNFTESYAWIFLFERNVCSNLISTNVFIFQPMYRHFAELSFFFFYTVQTSVLEPKKKNIEKPMYIYAARSLPSKCETEDNGVHACVV